MLKILDIKKLFNRKNNLEVNENEEKKTVNGDDCNTSNNNNHGDDGDVNQNYQDVDDDGDRDSGINFEDELPFNELQLKVKEYKHILYVLEKNKLIKDKQREALE